MSALVHRAWNSPTLMSWGGLAVRLGSWVLLLPLVLRTFDTPDVAVWLLFGAIVNLQVVGNLGFGQTFMRAIANAEGGSSIAEIRDLRESPRKIQREHQHNAHALERLVGTLQPVYLVLALLWLAVLATAGSASVAKPISSGIDSSQAWIAWFVIVASTGFAVFGNSYASYLLGRNRVALVQRWDMLFAAAGFISAAATVWMGGRLLELTLVQQAWVIAAVLRNRWLCRNDPAFREGARRPLDREVLATLWPNAWRSGLGVLMSLGVVQASGLVYARLGDAADVASYLLGLRMIQMISQISQAPFYSKIPALARLWAEGRPEEHLALAARGMRLSHLTFTTGFLVIGLVMDQAMVAIGSSTAFVSWSLWGLLGLAFYAERAGAMHLQLYSTTNHIIWHIANGITGLAMAAIALALYPQLNITAFPVAMLLSYGLIYCPISYWYSYRSFDIKIRQFDLPITFLPLSVACASWSTACAVWKC